MARTTRFSAAATSSRDYIYESYKMETMFGYKNVVYVQIVRDSGPIGETYSIFSH